MLKIKFENILTVVYIFEHLFLVWVFCISCC